MADVKQAIKNYTSSGKKVSSLKKQLIKQGTMKKQAPTLKGGTKATKANVNSFAQKGFTPKDAAPVDIYEFLIGKSGLQTQAKIVMQNFKSGGVYLTSPG